MGKVVVLLALAIAAGTASAQIYPGGGNSAATAVPGGQQATVPLPPPSARDLEIRRLQQEYADRADREREEKERAAMRNSPAGIYHCQQIEQAIQRAQSGPVPRYGSAQPYFTENERRAMLKELLDLREKDCR